MIGWIGTDPETADAVMTMLLIALAVVVVVGLMYFLAAAVPAGVLVARRTGSRLRGFGVGFLVGLVTTGSAVGAMALAGRPEFLALPLVLNWVLVAAARSRDGIPVDAPQDDWSRR